MKLSERQERVLNTVRGRAAMSIPSLALRLGLKDSVLRYEINQLRGMGVLAGRKALINVRALGFSDYLIYIGISYSSNEAKQAFYLTIDEHPAVRWFSEIGGRFQLCLSVQVRGSHEVLGVMERLQNVSGVAITGKAISERVSFSYVPWDRCDLAEILTAKFSRPPESRSLLKDRTLVGVLALHKGVNVPSNRDIARILGLSPGTVDRQIQRLQQLNIIYGYSWLVNYGASNLTKYKLLVTSKDYSASFRDDLLHFCASTAGTTHLAECVGSWDYEISIEVNSLKGISDYTAQVYQKFGSRISNIESVPVFRFGTYKVAAMTFWEAIHESAP
jgi:DNA-binding Lrp family transcriptional regulator